MAKKKKDWLDIATKVATDTAIGFFIPGGVIGKAAFVAGKEIVENYLSDDDDEKKDEVQDNVDLAFEAFKNEDYEKALNYLEEAHSNNEIRTFYYYRMLGECHYRLYLEDKEEYSEKAELLGLSDDTDEDDRRWDKLTPLEKKLERERSLSFDFMKQSLQYKEEKDFIASKDDLAEVFWVLTAVCDTSYEQRRYVIAAMASDSIRNDAIKEYKSITNKILGNMDADYESLRKFKAGDWSDFEPLTEENKVLVYKGTEEELFSNKVDYHERQFIYIAKNIDTLAGCYDDNIQWLFTINALPKELKFPLGHPQPNSLYYAHPAKNGFYLPIEGADEELFNDKVRDFRRLAQCLGATEIKFRSVKGHSLSGSFSTSLNVEVGGDYKGIGGSVGYGNKRSRNHDESMNGQHELVQLFNPTKAPYIPEDVVWLDVDPEWQSLVKQRLEGNMLHYSLRISSRKTMSVTDSKMDEVKVAFKSFIANAHVNFSQQMERSFRREEETEWEINVLFKPLNELAQPAETKNTDIKFTNKELEYLDNIREFLEDDAEITPRERKMLDRIRQSLGISEERAKELEESLAKPQLTEDEQEYLDIYREYAEKGEITDKERRKLDISAKGLGISSDRAKEIEKME